MLQVNIEKYLIQEGYYSNSYRVAESLELTRGQPAHDIAEAVCCEFKNILNEQVPYAQMLVVVGIIVAYKYNSQYTIKTEV
jgi:hypothetical protein